MKSFISKVVPISSILYNESLQIYQHRTPNDDKLDALEIDVKQNGIMHPLTVVPSSSFSDKFHIADGFSRYIVAQKLNIQEVPVVIVDSDTARLFAITANNLRSELSILEKAKSAKLLDEYYNHDAILKSNGKKINRNISKDELAKQLGVSPQYYGELLKISSLPSEIVDAENALPENEKLSKKQLLTIAKSKNPIEKYYEKRNGKKESDNTKEKILIKIYKELISLLPDDEIDNIEKKESAKEKINLNEIFNMTARLKNRMSIEADNPLYKKNTASEDVTEKQELAVENETIEASEEATPSVEE